MSFYFFWIRTYAGADSKLDKELPFFFLVTRIIIVCVHVCVCIHTCNTGIQFVEWHLIVLYIYMCVYKIFIYEGWWGKRDRTDGGRRERILQKLLLIVCLLSVRHCAVGFGGNKVTSTTGNNHPEWGFVLWETRGETGKKVF